MGMTLFILLKVLLKTMCAIIAQQLFQIPHLPHVQLVAILVLQKKEEKQSQHATALHAKNIFPHAKMDLRPKTP